MIINLSITCEVKCGSLEVIMALISLNMQGKKNRSLVLIKSIIIRHGLSKK